MKLLELYPELEKFTTLGDNGVISISQEGLNYAEAEGRKNKNNLLAAS
jgi:hypothetical protein